MRRLVLSILALGTACGVTSNAAGVADAPPGPVASGV